MHRGECTSDDDSDASLFSLANSTLPRSIAVMAQPLPQDLPPSLDASQNILQIRTAYFRVFKLDQRFSNVAGANPDIRDDRLVRTRVIGHLIRRAPSILASEHVATEINSCANHVQLYQLTKESSEESALRGW